MNIDNKKSVDVGSVWWFWFSTNAFAVDKRLRHVLRVMPRDPRCKFCNAPFQGVGGMIVRVLFGKQRSALNPRYCNLCEGEIIVSGPALKKAGVDDSTLESRRLELKGISEPVVARVIHGS